jgi:hypothetical protein
MKSRLVIRAAIRKSIREAEEERMRKAYFAQPDSEAEANDWINAEEWKRRNAPLKSSAP